MDISGRHEEGGEYLMVAAAVAATVDSSRIEAVHGIGYGTERAAPTRANTVEIIRDAVGDLPEPPNGPIVAEHGEFYEEPAATVGAAFEAPFKYVESIAERETVQTAHHAAYSARKLLI